jgi:hypothetical protein
MDDNNDNNNNNNNNVPQITKLVENTEVIGENKHVDRLIGFQKRFCHIRHEGKEVWKGP